MEIGEKDVPGPTVRTEIHFAAYLYSIKTCNVFTPSGPEPSAPPLSRPCLAFDKRSLFLGGEPQKQLMCEHLACRVGASKQWESPDGAPA